QQHAGGEHLQAGGATHLALHAHGEADRSAELAAVEVGEAAGGGPHGDPARLGDQGEPLRLVRHQRRHERGLAGAGRGGHHHRAGGRGGLERVTGGADGQPRPDGVEVEAVRRGRCGGHRSIMPRRAPVRVLATAVNGRPDGWPSGGTAGRRTADGRSAGGQSMRSNSICWESSQTLVTEIVHRSTVAVSPRVRSSIGRALPPPRVAVSWASSPSMPTASMVSDSPARSGSSGLAVPPTSTKYAPSPEQGPGTSKPSGAGVAG